MSVQEYRSGPATTRGAVFVLGAAGLWGTTGTAASFAPRAASGVSIGAATMGIGGLVLLALAGRTALRPLRAGRTSVVTALLGAANAAIYPLAFYSSMSLAGVAVGTVVTIGSSPVFAALLERFLDGARLDRTWLLATAISAIGVAALVLGGEGPGAGTQPVLGVLLGLVSGASYAGYTFAAGRLIGAGHSSRAVVGLLFGLGTVVLIPVFVATGAPLLRGSGLVVTAYLALVPMSVAYVLYGAGLRQLRVTAVATLTLFEPVVAAVLSVFVVGERLGALAWVGAALIGIGLALTTLRGR
ncbi:DMT family transporter [Sciscionella sediminilitoris]|uniref:DMT family transporter n=1 Tax=Sciscionella sediminilitoris TaxID=1445613 RepID=UPI00055CFDB2|nr:EamA family transporter [Sciscionella sp. SE31]